MGWLDEVRASKPEYANLPDRELADTLYTQFYSDMDRAEFDKRAGRVTTAPAPTDGTAPRVPMEGGENLPPIRYTADGYPYYDPQPAGAFERTTEGATQAFGERPVGDIPGVGRLPGVPGLLATGADAALRSIPAAIVGGAGTIADLAEQAGLDKTNANKLHRDLVKIIESAMVVTGAGGRIPRPREMVKTGPGAPAPATEAAPATGSGAELAALEKVANEADAVLADTPAGVLGREAVDASTRARIEAERPPSRAGNINLDRIYAPEDVKAAIKQTADENADFIGARRGVVTQEETRDMAQMLGMSADDLARRRRGQAFNAEEMFAARELLVAQATKVRDLARRVEGGSDTERAAFAQEVTRLVAIQEQVSGATAEAGRALSQFRMLAGATKEEIAAMVEAAKGRGLEDVARRIASLDDPAQVAHFAANAYKATKTDMVYEAWINALLSGPTTHAANILSNGITTALGVVESGLTAGISKLTGSGMSLREPVARVVGGLQGAVDGIAAGWQAYRTEQATGNASKLEMTRPRAIPSANVGGVEIGGKQVRIPGRLLMAEDEFFKAIGYRQEINALAIRQAVDEGLTGRKLADRAAELRNNPTEEMIAAGRKAAEKQTFTNPLGKAGSGLQQMVSNVPGLRFVIPFIRTPVNIVKYATERSPFAPLFKEARENITGKNGPIARDNQIARMALGSTIMASTAYLASQGVITGGGPSQSEGAKRALMRADGWQPYSIRVGDNYYSYSRFEPFGMLMGVSADMVEMHDSMTKDEKANLGVLLAGSAARNLISKTWLRGPSEVMQAFLDPQRYGPRYLQGLFGTVVPTGLAQYANSQDPYVRQARTIVDTVRSRLPGESEKLFVRRDAFGEPIRREGALGPDLISPVYQSAAKNDPTIAEMMRLKVFPGRLPRTINNAELTDAEYDTYTRVSGQTARKLLDTLVNMPNWRDLPEAVQFDAMNDAIRKGRDVGRAMTVSSSPDLPLRILQGTMKKKHITAPARAAAQ